MLDVPTSHRQSAVGEVGNAVTNSSTTSNPSRKTKSATPMWLAQTDRKQKSLSKHLVGFLRLFRDKVLQLGKDAESALQEFFVAEGIRANAGGTVLKALRKLHKEGKLDGLINSYNRLLSAGQIVDPSPPTTLKFRTSTSIRGSFNLALPPDTFSIHPMDSPLQTKIRTK